MKDQQPQFNLEPVKAFYTKHLQKYAEGDIRTMGWHDQKEYCIRFGVMTAFADLKNHSLLDVGCGIGGLYDYLKDKGTSVQYHGVDIMPQMIERARKKYPHSTVQHSNFATHQPATDPSFPAPTFEVCNILTQDVPHYDYVFCIGALNIESDNFHEFFMSMLNKMISIAHKGVGINFLCNKDRLCAGPYHFENPLELKKELEHKYNVRVVVDNEESLIAECCLFIYKE